MKLTERILDRLDAKDGVLHTHASDGFIEFDVADLLDDDVLDVMEAIERLRDDGLVTWSRHEVRRTARPRPILSVRSSRRKRATASQRLVDYLREHGGHLEDPEGGLMSTLQDALGAAYSTLMPAVNELERQGVIVRDASRLNGTRSITLVGKAKTG